MSWTIDRERTAPEVLTIRLSLPTADSEQWILFTSDRHHDSIESDWVLETAHLKRARELDAIILDNGDLVDGMQGKRDRRGRLPDLHPELLKIMQSGKSGHPKDAYLNSVLYMCEDFYKPYATQLAMIGMGNHESSLVKHNELDIPALLARELRRYSGNGRGTQAMPYTGWVRLVVNVMGSHSTVKIFYHHGHGGSAPVTRGIIQTNRRQAWIRDANIIWTGHIHDGYVVPFTTHGLSQRGKPRDVTGFHVQTPGYKTRGNYEKERNMAPRVRGGVFMRLYPQKVENYVSALKMDFTLAFD